MNSFNRTIRSKLLLRNKKIRISISGLLSLKIGNNYVLIRNLRRPELFGPIGGVTKFYDSANSFLNSIEFEAEIPYNNELREDSNNDLRGFIRGKYLPQFINWFLTQKDRESNPLERELLEELNEINCKNIPTLHIKYRITKRVTEGPYKVKKKGYYQFRIYDVYEFVDDENSRVITEFIRNNLKNNNNLILASTRCILDGRGLKNEIIGSHCSLLLRNKRILEEGRVPNLDMDDFKSELNYNKKFWEEGQKLDLEGSKIKDLIAKGETDSALENLLSVTQNFSIISNEIILIMSRNSAINKKQRNGTIKNDEYQIEKSKINSDILQFIDIYSSKTK